MDLKKLFVLTAFLAAAGLSQVGCQSGVLATPQDGQDYAAGGGQYGDRSVEAYTRAIDQNPNDADAYFGRGFAYSLNKQYGLAVQDYSKAIELNPNYANAYENRGTVEYRMGLYRSAVDDFTKAIELNPSNALAYENRAWADYSLKEYDNAWRDIHMCRQRGGNPDPTLVEHLSNASGRSD
jgi:tetratricopeptide (TPR) repeat protein